MATTFLLSGFLSGLSFGLSIGIILGRSKWANRPIKSWFR